MKPSQTAVDVLHDVHLSLVLTSGYLELARRALQKDNRDDAWSFLQLAGREAASAREDVAVRTMDE